VIPIEVLFGVVVLIFVLIGVARGFLRELGVTMVLMFVLFFLVQFQGYFDKGFEAAFSMSQRVLPVRNENLIKCWVFLFIIIGTTFISYQGETIAFGGQLPKNSQRFLLGGLVGLLNGYLVAGSVWHYMDYFGYPIKMLGYTPENSSKLAQSMLRFLPVTFLGHEILFGMNWFLYLFALLLIARVIR